MTEEQLPLLAHNIFFTLHDGSPEAVARLVAACHANLKDHPGVEFFAAGTRADGLDRPVNDLDFHVGLHIVFRSRADHDRYQTAPRHLKFIEENKATWKQLRVFDSEIR